MFKKIIFIVLLFVINHHLFSQLTFSGTYPPVSSDKYEKDPVQINLLPGFKYSASTSPSNLLNLSISTYPSQVNSNYFDPFYTPPTTISENKVVGVIKGNYDVTPTGQFSYNMPIFCSPGTNGMEPKLSVYYNSLGSNGTMGVGFNLSGISAISRTNKTIFYDGTPGSIDISALDVFALDGKRLLAKTGVYGQANSTYIYQQEDYSTITSYGSQGVGPQYFIIKDANGYTTEYGKTSDSRLTGNFDNSVLSWYINKVTDEFGNYISFSYINNNGEILISQIQYTKNSAASSAPFNTINFDYMDRSDKNVCYVGGKEFNNTKILKSITCNDINGQLVRKYVFTYTFNVYSLLYMIVEIDADGNELNPTTFTRGSPGNFTPSKANAYSYSSFGSYYGIVPVDFNGDGYSDLSGLDEANAKVYTRINNLPQLQTNGNSPMLVFNTTSPQLVNLTNPGGFPISYLGTFTCDEDDDTQDEEYVYYLQKTSAFIGSKYLIDKIKTGPGNAVSITNVYSHTQSQPVNLNDYKYTGPTPAFQGYDYNAKPFFFDINDYTGDGNKDQLIVDQENITLIPIVGNTPGAPLTWTTNKYSMVKIGDVNGDGVLEIFNINASTYANPYFLNVIKYNASTQQLNGISMTLQLNKTPKLDYQMKSIDVSDFNGDGKSDVLTFDPAQAKSILVYLSDGAQFTSPLSFNLPTGFNNTDDINMSFKDVNNDGKADIIVKKITAYSSSGLPIQSDYRILYSMGKNVFEDTQPNIGYDFDKNTAFADFNADGNLDYYSNSQTNSSSPFYEDIDFGSVTSQKNFFVTKINTCKEEIDIEYNMARGSYDNNHIDYTNILANGVNAIYQEETPAVPLPTGFKIIKPSVYVTSRVKDNLGTYVYNYTNGIYHKAGNGFLGFQKFTKATIESNNYTGLLGSETKYNYNGTASTVQGAELNSGIYNYIAVTPPTNYAKIYKLTPDVNNISSKTTSLANFIFTSGNKYYTSYASSETFDYLKSVNTSEYSQFDNTKNGAVIFNSSIAFNWQYSAQVRQKAETKSYILNNGIYKPQSISTQLTQQGQPACLRDIAYTYDAAGHLLTDMADPSVSALSVTKTFSQFNAFGSPTQIDISAPDIQTRTTYLQYDNTGRFNTQKTNPNGDVEEYIYEPKHGKVIQYKDISGLITKYAFDGLGSLIQTTLPNNTINTVQFKWDTQLVGYFNGSYSVTTATAGSPKKILVYNNNDYVALTILEGFNGNTITSSNTYDLKGRVTESTDLHFTNQAAYNKTQYVYEPSFYRIQDQKLFSVASAVSTLKHRINYNYNTLSNTTTYNKGFVEVTDYNPANAIINKVRSENNEAGQTDKVINIYGTAHVSDYIFNSNGQPKQVNLTFPDGGTGNTQFTYDALGRQSTLVDQSAGTTAYTYNSIGQLIEQVTPNGDYTFTYDLLGRVITKSSPVAGTTSYQYVTGPNGKNQIQKITGPNVLTEYIYDYLGRTTEQKETVGAKVLKTNYAYDTYGNITNYTFPGNYQVQYVYDNIGTLTQIKNGNTVIWQLSSEFSPGMASAYTTGNGIGTTVNYDNYLNLKDVTYGTLHKQEYNFDYITGNLNTRKYTNSTNVVNYENFTYDAIQRLNTVYDNIGNTTNIRQTINYKNNGNIDYKSDAGNYVYSNTSQPYNLTNINNVSNNISLNTLNIAYNDFKKVSQITEASTNKQFDFTYGNDDERIKMAYSIGSNNQYTRFYTQNFDRQETATGYKEWNYIYAPTGLAAVYYNNNGNGQLLYTLTDYLGSPILLTNTSGQIVEEYNFDAWGRRRDPANWTNYSGLTAPQYMVRGYTMHEMLDEVGIVNMNGRIYDAVLGRFLQTDNYVQQPDNLQNFNRFSYVLNNPLKYTDPTGQLFGIDDYIAGIVIGAVVGGIINVATHWKTITTSAHPWRDGIAAFGIGAAGGAVAAATFGAGIGAVGGAAATYASVAYLGGVSAVLGEAVTNTGNVAYFHDRMNTAKDYEKVFAMGAAFAVAAKGVSDAFKPKTQLYPDYLEQKGSRIGTSVNEGELRGGGYSEPVPIDDGPKSFTLNKTISVNEAIDGPYTKSSLEYGRQMHTKYMSGLNDPENGMYKEFNKIPGIRPDFVDFNTKTIYELKPYNPRSVKLGLQQLNNYKAIFEQRYGGTWNTVLNTY